MMEYVKYLMNNRMPLIVFDKNKNDVVIKILYEENITFLIYFDGYVREITPLHTGNMEHSDIILDSSMDTFYKKCFPGSHLSPTLGRSLPLLIALRCAHSPSS